MKANSAPDSNRLRAIALGLLARREHSRFELARKLEASGFARADIAPLLDLFEEKNWLSDRRFAESYVADHRARAGSVKLAHALRLRGVADDLVAAALGDTGDSEIERAREVWRKKFGTLPAGTAEQAKQTRFLLGRGFPADVVRRVLDGREDR